MEQANKGCGKEEDQWYMCSRTGSEKVRMCMFVLPLFLMRVFVWHRLATRLIRLGVRKGVGRHTSPFRLKKNETGEADSHPALH